jgi:RimJ/RimL family protein N-acetyltransferase
MKPKIVKAAWVRGRTLRFRNATSEDAAFIHSQRLDDEKSRHLSKVSSDLEAQQAWLEAYSRRGGEAYFIILSSDDQPIGTVRLYDARGESFCWGSWILAKGSPKHAAIESALMVYAYGIDHLGFSAAHFQVRKANESVWQFHERFGARRVADDGFDHEYELAGSEIATARRRYARYLAEGVVVEGIVS